MPANNLEKVDFSEQECLECCFKLKEVRLQLGFNYSNLLKW